MKRICILLCICALLCALGVAVHADILPPRPVNYEVNSGNAPLCKYKVLGFNPYANFSEGEEKATGVETAGVIPPGITIQIVDEVLVDGKAYGVFIEKEYMKEPTAVLYHVDDTTEVSPYYGNWPSYKPIEHSYCILLEDVGLEPRLQSLRRKERDLNSSETTNDDVLAVDDKTTDAQTSREEETTAASVEAPSRTPTKTALVCVGAAIVLALTAVVTLTLIGRKRAAKAEDQALPEEAPETAEPEPKNEPGEETEQ